MSGIILRSPWTRQPQTPVGLDKAHPFAQLDPRLLYVGGQQGVGKASLRPITQVGNSALGVGPSGRFTGSTSSTAGGNYTSLGVNPETDISNFTGVAVFRMLQGTNSWNVFNTYMPAAVGGGGLAVNCSANSIHLVKNDVVLLANATPTMAANVDHRLAWSWNNSTGAYILALNGVIVGTGTGPTGTSFSTGREAFLAGYYPTTGGAATGFGVVYMCAIAANPTTNQPLVRSLSENPWQIIAPLPRKILVGVAAGTPSGTLATTNANDTLAASGSAVGFTGTLAKTNVDDTLAGVGTQTNTGTVAKTNADDTLAGVGYLEATGTLATTNANDVLAAIASNGTSAGGVGKSIRLREVEKREDLGEFIKAQLNLKHADLLPQEQKKRTKAQKAEQQKIDLAMKSMAQELEQERLVQANNDLLTLMLLAEV